MFKKKTASNEEEILAKYVELVARIKELSSELDPLKATVLAIVKKRGGDTFCNGMNITVASKPKWQYPDELRLMDEKIENMETLLKVKQKHARENGTATQVDAGEYVVCKEVKVEE